MSSVGENLKTLREEAGLSVKKLSEATKIQEKYLLHLESNEFEKLPSPVYIRGFIKKWANACGGSAEELILQFQRENQSILDSKKEQDKLNEITIPSFVITSKHIVFTVVILVVGALAAFFYYNQKLVSEVPQVEIVNPADFNSVTEEESIFIQGTGENVDRIFVNDREIEPQRGGNFEFMYPLNAGLNTIIIKAQSPEGRETETARKVLKL